MSDLIGGQQKQVVPNGQLLGPGGFMSTPGLENPVISTHVRPSGIDEYLPISPATVVNPLYPVFTGVTAETGAEPASVCDDGPTALLKGATMTAVFGRIMRSTPVLDKGQIAETVRGQTTDLRLLADRGAPGGRLTLGDAVIPSDDIFRYATRGAMFVVATILQRKLNKMIWQGSPANNNPATDGYREFPGLDIQIGTGRVDAVSGVAVPSLDSYVANANYVEMGTYNIVSHLQDMESVLRNRAEDMFGDAQFVLVMRPEMWEALSVTWPLQYNTQSSIFNLPTASTVGISVSADALVAERDRMRREKSIIINGNSYTVVTDHGIAWADRGDGAFVSSIYMLPLTVAGGFQAIRLEYLDFRLGIAQENMVGLNTGLVWTDDGRYIWSAKEEHTCFWFRARIEPRVILHTPHLAGKIQRIAIVPMSRSNDPDPTSAYHLNGGLSVRATETLFTPWSA